MLKKNLDYILIGAILLFSIYDIASAKRKGSKYSLSNSTEIDNHWSTFKKNHKKSYRNSTHESAKKKTFLANLNRINEHNQKYNDGSETYHIDINSMADMTSDEFMAYVNKGLSSEKRPNQVRLLKDLNKRATIPTSLDWRTLGKVNAIKDQGYCGSCSAFSATASLESAYAITNGVLPDLSEQNLVDCTYSFDMCQTGGWYDDEWNYIQRNKGINTQANYPYVSGSTATWTGQCKYNATGSFDPQITGYVQVEANELALAQAIATVGPVSVAIHVSDNFQLYSGGVFSDTTCPIGSINHAVTLVGYGTDSASGKDYYILRNSWGTSWGSSGYMNFQRNNNNMCAVASYAMYPKVAQTSSPTSTTNPTTVKTVTTTTTTPVKTTSTTVKTVTTTTTPVKTASTTVKTVTTTTTPVKTASTTSSSQSKPLCYNGNGVYPNSGCQSYYNCSLTLVDYVCPTNYLFDFTSQTCKLTSLVVCNPSSYYCPAGVGKFYPKAGCQYVYYCQAQTIQNFTCPVGKSYNPSTGTCVTTGSFTCPV